MPLRAAVLSPILLASLALAACGGEEAQEAVKVPVIAKAFTIKANAVPGRPAAGYGLFTGPANAMLTSATSSEAGRVELHIIEREGDVARMKKVDGLLIDSTEQLELKPGGAHLMIFDLAEGALDDGKVPLSFEFDTGAKITVEAKLAE